ncbi:hypothetical protein [Halioxenophilus sp. WMMB6]|uniref:hypothetical protein n=1 Tax=Halioxenophilus sp. WMMB6 TaxID=3073815 RepID=UPI00295E305D|nr:hypothetical protein [Halioxenophilus sp. WMMB6]
MRLPEEYRAARLELHEQHYPTAVDEFYRTVGQSIQLELDIEAEQLEANSEILAFIERHPEDTFILTSDMYLTSSHLSYLLNKLGIPEFYKEIFVSCEHNCSKEGFGKLFDVVAERYGREIIHIGDHLKHDFMHGSAKLLPAVHYVREATRYQPDYSSPEAYYQGYIDNILAPAMWLTIAKIDDLIERFQIEQIVVLGSVFDFYKDLLGKHFPKLPFKKLEISRYNIRYISYNHLAPKDFAKQLHTESFLKHFFPDRFTDTGFDNKNIVEKLKHLQWVTEQERETLSARATKVEQEFVEQLQALQIDRKKTLFLDFGYQGSFCELLQHVPMLANGNSELFLTVKEENKSSCHYGLLIPQLNLPSKVLRDPFWILDSEIIIKRSAKTPIAFGEAHQNSLGWAAMYDTLLTAVDHYQSNQTPYQVEKELTYKLIKHISTMQKNYYNVFNWLCEKVRYNKYSIAAGSDGIIHKRLGYVQVDTQPAASNEIAQFQTSYIDAEWLDLISASTDNKRHPLFRYHCYLKSIEWLNKNLRIEEN